MSQKTVGIIIGRFECSYLHEGYKYLIKWVSDRHERVIVFIGTSPIPVADNDPLPYISRTHLFPSSMEIYKLPDVGDVNRWSNILDKQIESFLASGEIPVLYGSRDKFAYTGKYSVVEVPEIPDVSSSKIRKEIGRSVRNDEAWREGVIWAAENKYPTTYPTVDMVILNLKTDEVLLGRKPGESLFRLPGGFADVNSNSYEDDAIRETHEETNLKVLKLEYIGSTLVDDWRYRKQKSKIKTLLYVVTHWTGDPRAGDDLEEIKWFPWNMLENPPTPHFIVPNHVKLVQMVSEWKKRLTKPQKWIEFV